MRFSFFCGHCKELIREVVGSPTAFPGWQQHEACGYETYFDKFVWRENEKDKQPVALETREIGDTSDGVHVPSWIKKVGHGVKEAAEGVLETVADIALENITGGDSSLPSAADLDAVEEEEKIAAATEATDGQKLLSDFAIHKTGVDDAAAAARKAVAETVNPPQPVEDCVTTPRAKGAE